MVGLVAHDGGEHLLDERVGARAPAARQQRQRQRLADAEEGDDLLVDLLARREPRGGGLDKLRRAISQRCPAPELHGHAAAELDVEELLVDERGRHGDEIDRDLSGHHALDELRQGGGGDVLVERVFRPPQAGPLDQLCGAAGGVEGVPGVVVVDVADRSPPTPEGRAPRDVDREDGLGVGEAHSSVPASSWLPPSTVPPSASGQRSGLTSQS